MKLINQITNPDNSVFGYIVEDGDIRYPIKEEGLWSDIIVDELLESGYTLRELPYGYYTPEGVSIAELEKIPYAEANITDADEIEMNDMLISRYQKAIMMTKLSATESTEKYHVFNKEEIAIETRDQLLEFLKKRDTFLRDTMDPMAIIPLNAFVSDSALLTLEEFMSPDYVEYRDMILNTMKLNYNQYRSLVSYLKGKGLPDKFTPKQLMDMYFSYGIPGIHINSYDPESYRSNYVFSYRVDSVAIAEARKDPKKARALPMIKAKHTTYLESSGTWAKNSNTSTGTWRPTLDEEAIYQKAIELQSLGAEYITPIDVESTISEEITKFQGSNFVIKYNDLNLSITYKEDEIDIHTLIVNEPGFTGRRLDTAFYNVQDDALKDYILDMVLCNYIVEKTTVRMTTSSYSALKRLGSSPMSAVKYFLNDGNNAAEYSINPVDAPDHSNIEGLKKEDLLAMGYLNPQRFADLFNKYLAGTLNSDHKLYKTVEYIISGVMNGTLNCDALAQTNASESRYVSMYYSYITVARKYLGLSFQEIFARISDLSIDTPYVTFEGNGMKMKMEIIPNDNVKKSYKMDVERYTVRQLNEASIIGYVSKAYTELSTSRVPRKHVAIEYLQLDLTHKDVKAMLVPIINKLIRWCDDIIENNYTTSDAMYSFYKSRARGCVLEGLYRIALKKEFVFFKGFSKPSREKAYVLDFTQDVIKHPLEDETDVIDSASVIDIITKCIERVYESTTVVSDYIINNSGKFITYFVNANVTPEYVVPKNGFSIPEVGLVAGWLNIAGPNRDKYLHKFKTEKILTDDDIRRIESNQYRCIKNAYEQRHFPVRDGDGKLVNPRILFGNLYEYYENADGERLEADGLEGNGFEYPSHPFELAYGKVFDEELVEKTLSGVRQVGERNATTGKYTWKTYPYQLVDTSIVLSRDPKLAEIYQPKAVQLETRMLVRDFKGFKPDDLLSITDKDKIIDLLSPIEEDTLPLAFADTLKNELSFADGVTIPLVSVPEYYEKGLYKIRRITANHYLIQSLAGKFVEVFI